MNWKPLETAADLQLLVQTSQQQPCLIYKHSPRCHKSTMMLHILETEWTFEADAMQLFLLDVVAKRALAAAVAERFEVLHQSPQLLLIKKGECTYDADGMGISVEELQECFEDDFF